MRIRRVRHSQIVWRQQSVTGVANSPVAVRVLHGRHKPILWKSKALAGTVSGNVSESATLADSVSAIYVGSVATAESVALSDTDAYPVTTFGQTVNRGRNPPIVWRQREAVATGTSFNGSFSDGLTLLDAASASQAFALGAIAESFTVADTNAPVGGSSVVSVVEAETVSEAFTTVWAFNNAVAESLNAADASTGLGGSSPTPANPGSGGWLHYGPHRKKTRAVEAKAEEPPVKTAPKKARKAAAKDAPEQDDALEEALRKLNSGELTEEQIFKIIADLL